MPIIEPQRLIAYVDRIFRGAGAPADSAQLVATSLVGSDLVGHDSHGVVRVRQYLNSIAAGDLNPAAEPLVSRETAVIALVDGQSGFGQVAAHFAVQKGIEKAQANGLAATGLFNSGHVGRL